jgi:RecJ-like exonuclease
MSFEECLRKGADYIKSLDECIVVTHYDCDGLSSGAILTKALKRNNIDFSLFVVKELTSEVIERVNDFSLPVIFTDLGESRLIENIRTPVVIIDHHSPIEFNKKDIAHINPELYGIHELSGSCVAYLVTRMLSHENKDLADIAITGAAGDMKLDSLKVSNLGEMIINDALDQKILKIEIGLRLFGYSSRPLHKALEYCFDPYIPGISGNESAVIQMLSDLGIEIKNGDKFRTLSELTNEEKVKLHTHLVMLRLSHNIENPEDIFGENYILTQYNYEVRELATILNAFGRLERFDDALRLCIDFNREQAESVINEYKTKLARYINMAEELMEQKDFISIIKGYNYIESNFVSPISTIFSQSLKSKILLVSAYDGEYTKMSIRNKTNIPVNEIVRKLSEELGGEGGGHIEACGARVRIDKEDEFIIKFEKEIKRHIQ